GVSMSDAPAIWRSAVPWSSVRITITLGRVVWAKASSSARARTAPVNATARIQDTRNERLMTVSPAHTRKTGHLPTRGPPPIITLQEFAGCSKSTQTLCRLALRATTRTVRERYRWRSSRSIAMGRGLTAAGDREIITTFSENTRTAFHILDGPGVPDAR